MIHCLLDRAYKICSSYAFFHEEIQKIKLILNKNEYPIKIVNREVKRYFDKKFNNVNNVMVEKKTLSLVLPYIGRIGNSFRERVCSEIGQFYPQVNVRVIFKSPKKLSDLFIIKDKTPKQLRSMVVYRVNCKCCDSFYIGKTKRCICIRMDEHKKDIKSSIHKHEKEKKHQMDWDGVEILDSASNDFKLLLKERLHINKLKPDLNVQDENTTSFILVPRTDI